MKKVNFKEMILLPEGTIYAMYEKYPVSKLWGIKIKRENCTMREGKISDFFESNFLIMDRNQDDFSHSSVRCRWGLFDESLEFLVYEKEDIDRMIHLLSLNIDFKARIKLPHKPMEDIDVG